MRHVYAGVYMPACVYVVRYIPHGHTVTSSRVSPFRIPRVKLAAGSIR